MVTILLFALVALLIGALLWQTRMQSKVEERVEDRVAAATSTLLASLTEMMNCQTTGFTTAISEVTGRQVVLTETLMLGRSHERSESLPTPLPESETPPSLPLDTSLLPPSAVWAMEEEGLTPETATLTPSSMPLGDLGPI